MAIYQLGDAVPSIAASAWVAESAQVIGRVELAEQASIWYGAVLRGDNEWLRIGERSNIQDGAILHTDMGNPVLVGRDVTVGHQVMLHSCIIGDGSLIGMQAVILNRARIGKRCIVGAGAVVTEGKEFPDDAMILGAPARVVRILEPERAAALANAAQAYVKKAEAHRTLLKRIG